MYCMYNGEISCKNQEEAELVKELLKKDLFNHPEIIPEDGFVSIQISDECQGNITKELIALSEVLKSKNVLINGSITYSGDYNGKYEIQNSECQEYSEQEIMVKEAPTDLLIGELKNRGYSVYLNVIDFV